MPPAYIRSPRISQGAARQRQAGTRWEGEIGPKQPQKCQRPRTTGARTSGAANYSVVVPAPELLSGNVAVESDIGIIGAFRKSYRQTLLYCGTSLTTGPLTTGPAGASVGASVPLGTS